VVEMGSNSVNAQYNVAASDSLAVKIAAHQRRKMYLAFLRISAIGAEDTLLDVGATSDQSYSHSNYLEAWYPQKLKITSVGLDDASFLEEIYPGLTFIQADGRDLPFEDRSFDFVHSSAVIEHVGNRDMQTRFARELWRVARKGVFVTTPNRWFPVEFHTVLPLLHWLPPPLFRKTLMALGREFFADEQNLNLLSSTGLKQMATDAGLSNFGIRSVSLFGWPTNLLLFARRN
jgi:SAM-dependent methyltransferase